MQRPVRRRSLLALLLVCPLLGFEQRVEGQPCPDYTEEKKPLFGDLHIHTRYSLDASTQATRTSPDQAYRFARGEPLGIQPWDSDGRPLRTIRLSRPLDFAAVTDHAELLGETQICTDPRAEGYDAWQCIMYRHWPRAAYYWFNYWSALDAERVGFCHGDDGRDICRAAGLGPWLDIRQAARRHNDPCRFTTFVGYEWTGGAAGDRYGNIHRNVIFGTSRVPPLPISYLDEKTPAGLFDALDDQCRAADDCQAVVIPHNSNLSAGIMFRQPADSAHGRQRARYETLAEIMQHKGSSECRYDPLGTDEFCAFEQLPNRSFTDNSPPRPGDGFLRRVLTDGLSAGEKLGVNPYRFGFIGSSDTHLGASGHVDETTFTGHGGAGVPAAEEIPRGLPDLLQYNPGGLAVLWAEENSRASLFRAMQRREAYATSGPRIIARFFAGEALPLTICDEGDFAALGHAHGLPMGSELPADRMAAMRIAFQAQQDPESIGLFRLQVVKGWLDGKGRQREKVFDLVTSDRVNRVEPGTCRQSGRAAASLCAVWQDPLFDPAQPAWYYGRVLEGPSCRWSQRLCVRAGIDCADPGAVPEEFAPCCAPEHRRVIHERAWTSPVWLTPARR